MAAGGCVALLCFDMLALLCFALRREGQGGEGKAREEKGRGGVGGCGRVGHLVARCSAVCRLRWGDLVESWSCEANI